MERTNKLGKFTIISIFFILTFILMPSCRKETHSKIKKNQLIDCLIQQAQDSFYQDLSFSRKQLKTAMKLAPDSLSFYEAYSVYVLTYSIINQYDSAYILEHQILTYCKHQQLSPRIHALLASANNTIGIYYSQMSVIDSAIFYYKIALKHYELANKLGRVPDMYINLADMYIRKGDYANCVFYYRRALSKSDSLHITNKMGFPIYFGLGQVYMELRDFPLSDSYFRLAEQFYKNRTLAEKFIFCNNRGTFYYYKEEYANALPWFKKAKAIVSHGDYKYYDNLCNVNLGDIYLNLNQLDSSKYYLDKSYAYYSKIQNQTALYYIATIKAGLALKQNNTQLASQLLEKNKDSTGIELSILTIRNKYLQKYYTRIGNFKQAYYFQSKNVVINDSIRNDRAKKKNCRIRYAL